MNPVTVMHEGAEAAREADTSAIDARVAWAREQGHASYLWPDVPPDAWRACMREIERLTACVLAGETGVPMVLPENSDVHAFGVASFTSGMGPLLGYWARQGQLDVPALAGATLDVHLEHGRARSARMAAELGRTLDVLSAADISAVVLKASHTSLEYFPEPGTRPAADIDLVVGGERMGAATDALRRAGYIELKAQRRPRKTDWLPPGQSGQLRSIDFTHRDNPFTVELHATADRLFYGVHAFRLGPLDLRNSRPAPEIHPAASVLVQPWLTAYLAAHASEELHQLQLVRLVELVNVIRTDRDAGRFDARALAALLEWLGVTRLVVPALELAERLAPGTLGDELQAVLRRRTPPRMRRVLEKLQPGTAQRLDAISLEERLIWVDGPLEMTRRLLHLLWPTRGENRTLKHLYRERLTRLIRGRVRLRGD